MTTTENLIKFQEEIKSVASYAKRIGFNFETGNFGELMNKWINHTKQLHEDIMDNKEEVFRIIKSKKIK